MLKYLLALVFISSLLMGKMSFLGIFKGNLKTYYTDIHIKKIVMVHNTQVAFDMRNDPAIFLNDAVANFKKKYIDIAKNKCKNFDGFALDNFQVQFQTIGNSTRTFIYISCNIVCY